MQLWEYDVYPWLGNWGGIEGAAGRRDMLNTKGAEGWELVTVTENIWVFKRPRG